MVDYGAELEEQRPFDGGPLGFMAFTSGFEPTGSGRFVGPWAEISRPVPGLRPAGLLPPSTVRR